ncbi:MAG: hypothetical protein AAGL89_07475 [Pseudomonadota bacterium]
MPEYAINCLPTDTRSGGDEELRFEIEGKTVGVKLRISRLNQRLVSYLPDRALDLLEIATLVYGVDAAVSRGGSADQNMGRKWHRRFIIKMPVRDYAFWSGGDVSATLEKTLMFLSGDRFEFDFSPKAEPEAEQFKYFDFGMDSSWKATRVLMFSGGLDSFAGALEKTVDQHQRVALVSHFSASKIAPVQRALQKLLAEKFGQASCKHVPVGGGRSTARWKWSDVCNRRSCHRAREAICSRSSSSDGAPICSAPSTAERREMP